MRTWANSTINDRIVHMSLHMVNTRLQEKNNIGILYLNKGRGKQGHGQTLQQIMNLCAKLHG